MLTPHTTQGKVNLRMRRAEVLNVRVDERTKLLLETVAQNEDLAVSDICRRAFREYMERRQMLATVATSEPYANPRT